jgi:hypothetical protein
MSSLGIAILSRRRHSDVLHPTLSGPSFHHHRQCQWSPARTQGCKEGSHGGHAQCQVRCIHFICDSARTLTCACFLL